VLTAPAASGGAADRFTAASLLLCGAAPALVRRAVMLACAKFLSRVEEIEAGGAHWLGLLHDAPHPGAASDEAVLWDVLSLAARTQSAAPRDPYTPPPGSQCIDDVLARARGRLERLTPTQARAALLAPAEPPALLIDIRPAAQRAAHGGIHGSLLIERNVLEWRLDPRSGARLSIADRYDLRAIVFCQEGYTSSLAAAALQELGLWNATDVVGGFAAWRKAGLPTELRVGDGSDDGASDARPPSVVSGMSIAEGDAEV
jgi:rhodanese-related sulfurtransferase